MSINYTTLKTELTTDPDNIGYSGFVAAGDDVSLASLLNRSTSGAVGTGFVFRNDVRIGEVINAIASGDFIQLSQIQISKTQLMFAGGITLDASNSNFRTNFGSIYSGMGSTQTNLSSLAQHMGSRAENLFGYGVTISVSDVGLALNH